MELPHTLKTLYRHWDFHTQTKITPPRDLSIPEDLSWFIQERLAIGTKKTASENPPYTSNPILAKYRFCNIFREFDRQTIEFHELLSPLREDF